jgi:hypothetical protein
MAARSREFNDLDLLLLHALRHDAEVALPSARAWASLRARCAAHWPAWSDSPLLTRWVCPARNPSWAPTTWPLEWSMFSLKGVVM